MHPEVEDAIPETRWIWAQQPLEEVQSELARLGDILWCDDLTRELEMSTATGAGLRHWRAQSARGAAPPPAALSASMMQSMSTFKAAWWN